MTSSNLSSLRSPPTHVDWGRLKFLERGWYPHDSRLLLTRLYEQLLEVKREGSSGLDLAGTLQRRDHRLHSHNFEKSSVEETNAMVTIVFRLRSL